MEHRFKPRLVIVYLVTMNLIFVILSVAKNLFTLSKRDPSVPSLRSGLRMTALSVFSKVGSCHSERSEGSLS
jgi:hypothetical protein